MKKGLPDGNGVLREYEPFAAVDCIVTDLDGTLTVGSTPVLQQIQNKILHLRKLGVFTTIATGRTYAGARRLIDSLNIDNGTPIAIYNGAVLIEHNSDNLIAICTIPYYTVEKLLEIIGKDGAGIYIYTFNLEIQDFFSLLNQEHIVEKVYYTGNRRVQFDVNGMPIRPFEEGKLSNEKIVSILLQRDELDKDIYDYIIHFLEADATVTYTDSGSGFVEIKAILYNKGVIISELKKSQRMMKRSANTILAIGDNDNDVDLLKAADISVAVANASMSAIKCADYICKNENAKGFLDMLTVIENAKRFFK
ncbi:MAG: Cof-type HAD-IIB family hydrolase [Lachnoclostridium sp.]|nr:Cof-type HAD-IIB family hydrolase [Lachnoclostridium sp.]